MMKPGVKSTEFWLSLASTIIGLVASIFGHGDHSAGLLTAGIASGSYAISRGLAKRAKE